jgi:hypothetical protein
MVDRPQHDQPIANGADRDAAQTLNTTADVVPLPRWRRGFVTLPRGWLDHPVFRFRALVYGRAEAFAWLVEHAAWAPHDGLERGQLRASIRMLGDAWKWHPSKVLRFLRDLRMEQIIDFRGTHNRTEKTPITICNYADFSPPPPRRGTVNGTENPKTRNRVLTKENHNPPIPLTGDSPPVGNGGRRRRGSPLGNLWEGARDAVEAVLARDAARANRADNSPVAALLDGDGADRRAPDANRGLD